MSGTSADGVDVAITQIAGLALDMQPELLLHHHAPYPQALRQAIFAARGAGQITLISLADLARQISLCYAQAVREALIRANLNLSELTAIAAHGQTLFHSPPNTIQWLDPALLAHELNCRVISDFRRADCAAGGQGAPLVPFADFILFRDSKKSRIVLNIGGIANITYLAAGGSLPTVIAFDTGPGNCVSDWLCRTHNPTGPGFDISGQLAAQGNPQPHLIDVASADPFFSQPPPRSTDTPAMISLFESAVRQTYLASSSKTSESSINDLLATACHWSAVQIARAIDQIAPPSDTEILASGGGTENQCLMGALRQYTPLPIIPTDAFGIPSAAREAVAFALLAAATLDNQPSNVPSVTGASHPVVLGSITPKP